MRRGLHLAVQRCSRASAYPAHDRQQRGRTRSLSETRSDVIKRCLSAQVRVSVSRAWHGARVLSRRTKFPELRTTHRAHTGRASLRVEAICNRQKHRAEYSVQAPRKVRESRKSSRQNTKPRGLGGGCPGARVRPRRREEPDATSAASHVPTPRAKSP